MSRVNYDDFEIGTAVFTYKTPEGSVVPKKGEIISTPQGKILIVDSSQKENYMKVMLLDPVSVKDRFEEYKLEVEKTIEEIAQMLYESTSTGLSKKIGWENLPEEEESKYLILASNIINLIDDKDLLILDYSIF